MTGIATHECSTYNPSSISQWPHPLTAACCINIDRLCHAVALHLHYNSHEAVDAVDLFVKIFPGECLWIGMAYPPNPDKSKTKAPGCAGTL